MLSVEDVARHWSVTADTVRSKIKSGDLRAVRLGRIYRLAWADVWSAECGQMPDGALQDHYKAPLLTRKSLAERVGMSTRSVDRWIQAGLPTRSVFGAVRINPYDAEVWLQQSLGVNLPGGLQP